MPEDYCHCGTQLINVQGHLLFCPICDFTEEQLKELNLTLDEQEVQDARQ